MDPRRWIKERRGLGDQTRDLWSWGGFHGADPWAHGGSPVFRGCSSPNIRVYMIFKDFLWRVGWSSPNIRSLDPGTCESYVKCAQVCRLSKVNCLLSYGVQFLVGSTGPSGLHVWCGGLRVYRHGFFGCNSNSKTPNLALSLFSPKVSWEIFLKEILPLPWSIDSSHSR